MNKLKIHNSRHRFHHSVYLRDMTVILLEFRSRPPSWKMTSFDVAVFLLSKCVVWM